MTENVDNKTIAKEITGTIDDYLEAINRPLTARMDTEEGRAVMASLEKAMISIRQAVVDSQDNSIMLDFLGAAVLVIVRGGAPCVAIGTRVLIGAYQIHNDPQGAAAQLKGKLDDLTKSGLLDNLDKRIIH